MEFLIPAISFLLGAALAAAFLIWRIIRLEKQNTELTAQVKAEKAALERAGAELDNRFKLTAQDALSKSAEQFLNMAQEKLKAQQKDGIHDLEKRSQAISELIKPVQKQLETMNQAVEQIKGTDMNVRQEIQSLSKETARLVGALRDPSAQGNWGEYILEGLLDKSGLIKGIHYETQKHLEGSEGRQRPDVVISMQDGFNIVVDAKAPVNELAARLGENLSEEEHQTVMRNLAAQVRNHVKQLGRKNYWENLDSPDFVVLFLPSELLYSMALRADPTLVDTAAENSVIIASPTLLMSLLRVVAMSWRQVELAESAAEISERGQDLYKRLLTFTGHLEKVGKNIHTALTGYNDAVGSLERSVLPAARKFKALQPGANAKDLPEFKAEDEQVRRLNLADEDEEARKRA